MESSEGASSILVISDDCIAGLDFRGGGEQLAQQV